MHDMELELENEFELENPQGEQFLGGLLSGVGNMLGLNESEFEGLGEGPYGETALGEGPLGEGPYGEVPLGEGPLGEGPLGEYEDEQFVGGLLGETSYESEDEAFFGKAFKGLGGLIKRVAPVLKQVAKTAAPMVGAAIGGPLGGKIGSFVSQALPESEFESEYEYEFEGEGEAEFEAVMEGPLTEQQGLGELMAAIASKAATDTEAEAQIGGAVAISLSPRDRDTLKAVIPSLTRGAAILTRILRRQQATRPVVRVIPTIVKRTAVSLKKQAAAGQPVTKKTAARTMAKQTKKVLSSTPICARAVQRNVKATRAVTKRTRGEGFAY